MAKFITTIELFNASEADYDTLHAELKKQYFKETHRQKGNEAASRRDEYNREGNVTLQEVTDAVLRAASKTGKKYSFTVIRNKPVYN